MRKILIVLLMSLFFISPVYADNHGIHMMKAYIRQEMQVNLLSQVLFQTCSLLQIV